MSKSKSILLRVTGITLVILSLLLCLSTCQRNTQDTDWLEWGEKP
ncbi:MAG: hypothetical protein POELPBGB_02440 [Bacteroidia bacterium]|nr:hypothetical protein [Bacteroidia bacterium]